MTIERIRVDVPVSDARRDRVERDVFSRLAAIRTMDRVDAATRPPRRAWFGYALAGAAACALLLVVLLGRDPTAHDTAMPSLVVTPVGGSSRFTVGDAVIDARGDTSVSVQTGDDGATTLVLARGSIDCEVAPRNGRPPFRVIAGDTTVEVVGTRFTVTRMGAGARVDVMHGKVAVHTPQGERMVTAGDSWTPPIAAQPPVAPPPPAPTPIPDPMPVDDAMIEIESAPPPARNEPPRSSPRDAFQAAQRLEATDPDRAARGYRGIANGKGPWAALALYGLADVHASRDPDAALRDLDELHRRFPRAANAEDAAWLRVFVLRRAGRTDDARAAATAYLGAFPGGTYVKQATRLAAPP